MKKRSRVCFNSLSKGVILILALGITSTNVRAQANPTVDAVKQEFANQYLPENLPDPKIASYFPQEWKTYGSTAARNPVFPLHNSEAVLAEQQGRQAGLYPNPSVGYSGKHIRGGEYGGGEQGAYLQQEIVLGGKLSARRNVYQQEAKVNQIGVEEQSYRVQDSVQQAFYRALTAESLVVVRQRLLKVTLDALETAHQLSNVGQADAPDVLQAEVEAEQAKVDFVRAQREYTQRFHTLAAVAGAQHLEVVPLKGELDKLPVIDPEQQVAMIVSESPMVKRAQQEVAVAEARLKDARREPVPNITVKAGEWWSGETIESSH